MDNYLQRLIGDTLMHKTLRLHSIMILLLAIVAQPCAAHASYLFGPAIYERGKGSPTIETATFTSPVEGSGFLLKIHNGDDVGDYRITSATVSLNGEQLVGPSDFNNQFEWIERAVFLQSVNEISVTLVGSPGDFFTLSIEGEITPLPSTSFTASPEAMKPGESSVLSWSTTNADFCTLEPEIGNIPLNGSIIVTPTQTTTYTLIATGPGGTVSSTAIVSVFSPPEITFSATPAIINEGEISILSWNILNADSAAIDNGIGSVPVTGSISVIPDTHTEYIITAIGPGGTTTASATVWITPFASLTITPGSLFLGQSATLTWETSHADTVTIDNNMGGVAASGSMSISPTTTMTYTLTATGLGGTVTSTVTVTVDVPPSPITITTPLNNSVITRSDTEVSGFLNGVDSTGIGIVLNGVPAIIDHDRFVANHVGLAAGENLITATLTYPDGSSAQESITVTAVPDKKYITLHCLGLESGLAPLEITLRVDGNFAFAEVPIIRDSGPEPVEFLAPTEPETIKIRMNAPGVYYFTAEVRDENGDTFLDTLAVPVLDKGELETTLRGQWGGMKSALAVGDIETGLSHFISSTRERYRGLFERIADRLPQIVGSMEDIEMIYFENNIAKYRIRRIEDINGSPTLITYYIYFSQDSDGRYKIFKF